MPASPVGLTDNGEFFDGHPAASPRFYFAQKKTPLILMAAGGLALFFHFIFPLLLDHMVSGSRFFVVRGFCVYRGFASFPVFMAHMFERLGLGFPTIMRVFRPRGC